MGTEFILSTSIHNTSKALSIIGFQAKEESYIDFKPLKKRESPIIYVDRVAKEHAIQSPHQNVLVIFKAVFVGRRLIMSPKNHDEISSILKLYSGRNHTIHTAIVLKKSDDTLMKRRTTTRVKVKPLSLEDKKEFIASNEWVDKIGGYDTNGLFRSFIIKSVGSPFGVMPFYEVRNLMTTL
ncbi:MAG: septum formation protein [Candidatus Deianiraeaceae bacterium]|jgi:septum formation protein